MCACVFLCTCVRLILIETQTKSSCAGAIFGRYGGGDVNRYLYRKLAGVDLVRSQSLNAIHQPHRRRRVQTHIHTHTQGPPRPPLRGITEAQYAALVRSHRPGKHNKPTTKEQNTNNDNHTRIHTRARIHTHDHTLQINDLDKFGFFTQALPPYPSDEHTEL